ncbi:hypothetical protein CRUP_020263 [Coryphaenoides rupestris]|nr:hypothetical protein CRUP_020263 [Coryphaenoides rupestris]
MSSGSKEISSSPAAHEIALTLKVGWRAGAGLGLRTGAGLGFRTGAGSGAGTGAGAGAGEGGRAASSRSCVRRASSCSCFSLACRRERSSSARLRSSSSFSLAMFSKRALMLPFPLHYIDPCNRHRYPNGSSEETTVPFWDSCSCSFSWWSHPTADLSCRCSCVRRASSCSCFSLAPCRRERSFIRHRFGVEAHRALVHAVCLDAITAPKPSGVVCTEMQGVRGQGCMSRKGLHIWGKVTVTLV